MKELIKKSFSDINSQIKEIILFSIIANIIAFSCTLFLPVCGVFASTMVSFYMLQVFIAYSKDGIFDINDLPEPNIVGILKCCGVKIVLAIPVICIIMVSLLASFGGLLKISIFGLFNLEVFETLAAMMAMVAIPIVIGSAFLIIVTIIIPFISFVLLDEDFKDTSFWDSLKISMNLAKGYRVKVLKAILFNYALTIISIFTLGLALVYTQPLYLILMSNIYNESKKEKLVDTSNTDNTEKENAIIENNEYTQN